MEDRLPQYSNSLRMTIGLAGGAEHLKMGLTVDFSRPGERS